MSTINISMSEMAVFIMENNSNIIESWSFMDFCRKEGQPKLASFTNRATNESFNSIAFLDEKGGVKTLVNFSEKLGQLSAQEISARKNDLQVVLNDKGYYLCNKGQNSWEDISVF